MTSKPETVADLVAAWSAVAKHHREAMRDIDRENISLDPGEEWHLHQAEAECYEKCARELEAIRPAIPAQRRRDVLIDVAASLAAAISLLERVPTAKKGAPSDKMFDVMLSDYRKSLERARVALASVPPQDSEALDHRLDREYANGVQVCLAILGDFNVRNDSNDAAFKMMEKIVRDRIEGSRPWTAVAKPSHSQEVTTVSSDERA